MIWVGGREQKAHSMQNLLDTHPQYAVWLLPFAGVLTGGTGLSRLDHGLRNAPGPIHDRRILVPRGAAHGMAGNPDHGTPSRCGQVQRAAVVADDEAAALEDGGCLPQGCTSGEVDDVAAEFGLEPVTQVTVVGSPHNDELGVVFLKQETP